MRREMHELNNRKEYTFFARFYDRCFYWYLASLYQAIEQSVAHVYPDKQMAFSFLDVACGTGEIIHRLHSAYPNAKFTGIDLTPAMIEKAQEKKDRESQQTFLVASAERLPFPDQSFDFVLCSEAFHHFFDGQAALCEIHRVLKLHGMLLLVDIAHNTWYEQIVFGGLSKIFEAARHYSTQDLEQMLIEAGFFIQIKSHHHWNHFFLTRCI